MTYNPITTQLREKQAVESLQWGVDHIASSQLVVKAALAVGATAVGAPVLVGIARTFVVACGSGVVTPACSALSTELGIAASEAISGIPTLGLSAPTAALAASRLKALIPTNDTAAIAKEMQVLLAEIKAEQVTANQTVKVGANSASKVVDLTFDKGTRTWTTPAGIDYGPGSVHGNRVQHILDHAVPNPTKTTHSVFNVDRKEVLGQR